MKIVNSFLKRSFDLISSIILIIILLLPMIVIAIFVKTSSEGPIIFKQTRIGKEKKLFRILKFRTMYTHAKNNVATHQLENPDKYITKVGKFLRKTSLDELPQLFNILKGEMSFVGPRPALYNQYDLILLRDKYNANSIKPGLTGLAQISGRDELDIEKKAILDGEYAKKMNVFFDIKILIITVIKVCKRSGIVEGKK